MMDTTCPKPRLLQPGTLLALMVLLGGCTSFEYRYSEAEEASLLAQIVPEKPVDRLDPLFLSDEVRARLDTLVRPGESDQSRLRAVRKFLFDEPGLAISYDANRTQTAMELWVSRAGNCLSMTNLFIAAARHLGIDANYETVAVKPTWNTDGSTMIRYEHIVATGRLSNGEEYVIDFLPDFVIGGRRSRQIDDEHALALFYSNLGAEAFIDGQLPQAIEHLRAAIALEPDFSDAWNNLGAAYRRTGQTLLAEFSYQRALYLDKDNFSALSNLAQFYSLEDREAEADFFIKRVERYRRRNPYFHYFLAGKLFQQREFEVVIQLLEYAIRLKRDEPDFYDAMAKTYEQLDDRTKEARYLALADKYRNEVNRPPPMEGNSRFWVKTIRVY